MNYKNIIITLLVSFVFSKETVVHINSTYFDGTPKQIIIYEYSTLYTNNPLKVIDTLNFDKDGNLMYDFDTYFNDNWTCAEIGNIQIINNKFKILDSASCLDCYSYMDNWNIVFTNNQIYVNLDSSIFLSNEIELDSSRYNFGVEITSIDSFILKLGSFEYNFKRK
mgnify:CR=1 FL=1